MKWKHARCGGNFAWLCALVACGGDASTKPVNAAPPEDGAPSEVDIDASLRADGAADSTRDVREQHARDGETYEPPQCGDKLCACADGVDNDGDGPIDLADPDCASPYANDEQPYKGSWGDHRYDDCQGCFFSGAPGASEDGCRVPFSCVMTGTSAPSGGSCSRCAASEDCQDYCLPFVPKGCDCFGCCGVIEAAGETRFVLVDDDCDPHGELSRCKSCVLSTTCVNPCERCDVCPGQARETLPADCALRDAG